MGNHLTSNSTGRYLGMGEKKPTPSRVQIPSQQDQLLGRGTRKATIAKAVKQTRYDGLLAGKVVGWGSKC
ncbi:hypothetical protein LCGC14_0692020 [marine sediment metagenome]|uniref:Uncharacterized protein n=1 Tax=marine sediment metagenome TaxID=412755 RepID=A0A0F9R5F7_9ZZZZ